MEALYEFDVSFEELTDSQKAVVEKLIQAAKLIAPIYEAQENEKYEGANFYPHDVTKEEIEKAAKENSQVLDPYTMVERNPSGELTAIPFHQKFKGQLEPIAKLLTEAGNLSEKEDKDFGEYLKSRAKSLLDGSYQESEIKWLQLGPTKIDMVIGPVERYLDKLFFIKCAYQAHVGILSEERMEEVGRFKEIIYRTRKKAYNHSQKVVLPKSAMRVDKTPIFSGLYARFMFEGANLPNDSKIMEKYGSKLMIYESPSDLRFKKQYYPVFGAVFEDNFRKSYDKELLKEGSLKNTLLHEISHTLIRYHGAEERLKEFFPIIDELYAYVLGGKSYGLLHLKGLVTQKEVEAILIMWLCRAFVYWWVDLPKNPGRASYVKGYAVALNFFLRKGAIEETGGISWPNFKKLYSTLEELAGILERLMAVGSYEEVKSFVDKYGDFSVFEKFRSRLESLSPERLELTR